MTTDKVKQAFAEYRRAILRLNRATRRRTKTLENLCDACAHLQDACADMGASLEEADAAYISGTGKATQSAQKQPTVSC